MNFKYIVLLFFTFSLLHSQTNDENLVLWNPSKKLTIDDFGIKITTENEQLSYGQFSIDSNIKGFDFFTKNFNKKVRNYFIKSASWINPIKDVEVSLKYQQTVFDIGEIYTRKFSKELKNNRKQILKGFQILEELNQKSVTEFSNRRLQYNNETNFGTIADKQIEWEKQIQKELEELKEYSY